MKKNFLKVAALLIAAMLLVVSCSQEVAPKEENNGLVDAKLNVAFGKAVKIEAGDDAKIGYKYSLTPMWDPLSENGGIYGVKADEPISGEYSVSSAPRVDTLGHVTPGLWKVEVKGYLLTKNEDQKYSYTNKEVLKGEATVFFGNNKDTVTVFVSPIDNANAKGTVTIELEMQDLEDNDVIWYSLDDKAYESIARGEVIKDNKNVEKAAHKYKTTVSDVSTGYHTISFKIGKADGSKFQSGGVKRSFYLIEGNNVSITGSVTPAEFAQEGATISVLSLNTGTITLSGDNIVSTKTTGGYKAGASCKATVSGFGQESITGAESVVMAYSWYWGIDTTDTVKQQGATISDSPNEISINLPSAPGKYTLSCIATCTVKYKNADNTITTYTIKGDAALQEFVVD